MASLNKKQNPAAASPLRGRAHKITTAQPTTVNKAGGKAFDQADEEKFLFILLTSFFEDEFYRTSQDTVTELQQLIKKINPVFAAQAILYARTKFGMRSICHVAAAILANTVKGQRWTKEFFSQLLYRVDDAAETIAAYYHLYGKTLPNSMKKGFAKGMLKFDAYQLAKWRGEKKAVTLYDVFNLVHPKPTPELAETYRQLMRGELKSTDTWESQLSAVGQSVDEEDQVTAKAEIWSNLLDAGKLGYLALLRNLNNILKTGDDKLIDKAAAALLNEQAIKGALILPFQFGSAYDRLMKEGYGNSASSRRLIAALEEAVEISLNNVPVFPGNTLVAMDVSWSMTNVHKGRKGVSKSPAIIGAMFAAVIARSNNADLLVFDWTARQLRYGLNSSIMSIRDDLASKCRGSSTDFGSIFTGLEGVRYDRIIILSDMQAWIGETQQEFRAYCERTKADPILYCFDLSSYGTLQFPAEHVYSLAGFSDKTLSIMRALETDRKAAVNAVREIVIPYAEG